MVWFSGTKTGWTAAHVSKASQARTVQEESEKIAANNQEEDQAVSMFRRMLLDQS
jgi:hypothetical protein